MKPTALLAAVLVLTTQSACGQPADPPKPAPAPAAAPTQAAAMHFIDMTATPLAFVRLRGDPDEAQIRLDLPAIDAVKPDEDGVVQVKVSYDGTDHSAWSAEKDLDPKLEAVFASTGAIARLVATSTTAYQRDYWFVTADDISPVVTALRTLPSPPGALIAVIRSNRDTLQDLKPKPGEAAQ
jgi:hypothetical protein